jgi:hypothetical protein
MPEELTFKHDLELELPTPTGGVCAPIVNIELLPRNSGCLVYGTLSDGNIGCIEVRGSKEKFELPFLEPTIYVKFLLGTTSVKITTVGYRDVGRIEGR